MVIGIITFSCKKVENDIPVSQNSNKSENVLDKIKDFKNTMDNNLKAGGSLYINDAVWNLEALISYENAYPDSSSRNFVTYRSYYTVSIDQDSLVNTHDLQTVYQQMLDSVSYDLSTIDASMKYLVFSDVELDTIIGSTAYISSLNGYGFNYILGWYENFDDNWIWGSLGSTLAGNCSGTDFSSDGSDEIQFRLNNPVVQTIGADGYTDYQTVWVTDIDLESDNRIYWDNTGNLTNCLSISQLTTYLSNAHDIIYLSDDTYTQNYIEGKRTQGKDFISIEVKDELVTSSGTIYLHQYVITYATPYWSGTE